MWEVQPEGWRPPRCGARRSARSHTWCELPPDHVVGRDHVMFMMPLHLGRSTRGYWHEWGSEDLVDGGDEYGEGPEHEPERDQLDLGEDDSQAGEEEAHDGGDEEQHDEDVHA